MPGTPIITIGKYQLERFLNYKSEWAIWIRNCGENNCQEGMETSIKELEEALDKFYKEKF